MSRLEREVRPARTVATTPVSTFAWLSLLVWLSWVVPLVICELVLQWATTSPLKGTPRTS